MHISVCDIPLGLYSPEIKRRRALSRSNILALIGLPFHSFLHGMWDLLDTPLLYPARCFPALLGECSHLFVSPTVWLDIHTFHKILLVTEFIGTCAFPMFLSLSYLLLCFAFCNTVLMLGSRSEMTRFLCCYSSSNVSHAACGWWTLEKWYLLSTEPHVLLLKSHWTTFNSWSYFVQVFRRAVNTIDKTWAVHEVSNRHAITNLGLNLPSRLIGTSRCYYFWTARGIHRACMAVELHKYYFRYIVRLFG